MDFQEFVLAASTSTLAEESDARSHADAVEFRLDLASDGQEQLQSYDGRLPLIVTNRPSWEGGETTDSPQRLAMLEEALEHPQVEAIDIELETLQGERAHQTTARKLLASARDRNVTVIVSAHDFDSTPDVATLQSILDAACELGDVGKLAVTAQDRGDVLELLSVTHDVTERGKRVATMAMGEPGRHSRAVAPLYGSRIGYAPIDPENATAPGQYDLSTLRSLVSQLNGSAI